MIMRQPLVVSDDILNLNIYEAYRYVYVFKRKISTLFIRDSHGNVQFDLYYFCGGIVMSITKRTLTLTYAVSIRLRRVGSCLIDETPTSTTS